LLYQQDIRDMSGMDGFNIETVDVRQNQAASQTILDMEILDGSDGLQLMIDYAASRYEDESIEKFEQIYIKLAQAMVTHNSQQDITIREIKAKIKDEKNIFAHIILGLALFQLQLLCRQSWAFLLSARVKPLLQQL